VNIELVRKRVGYLKRDTGSAVTPETARKEAERCLNCGCGEGCQLCKTICAEFAPDIVSPDTLAIDRSVCAACGMCYAMCPAKNIEMVDLGEKI